MNVVDSHAHLNFSDFGDDLEKVVVDTKTAGVGKIINIGTSLADSKEAIELAIIHDGLFATVGIHPNDNPEANVENVDWVEFEKLCREPKVVAVGECGLDYSREKGGERQLSLFEKQIAVARKLDLPLVIHVREAQGELISVFGHSLHSMRGVFHCFSGDENYLNTILRLLPGFNISFAGNITFKNAVSIRDLAKLTPLERLMVETDSPFLTPEPFRGQRNNPANVKIVAERIAEIKGMSLEEVSEATVKNAEKLFNI